jgi:hypothetical protein
MPDGSIIQISERTWKLGEDNPAAPGNRFVEINGVRVQDASGSKLEVCNGKIWTLGRLGMWWTYESGKWVDIGSAVLPCK